MPGKFIPQCTEHGYFKPQQCHSSTGRCWCVVPDTGKAIESSTTINGRPECTACLLKRAESLRPHGFIGNTVPECDENGLFKPEQGSGSTGHRWCANTQTGEEITGTRIGAGAQRLVNCAVYQDLATKGPCYAEVAESRYRQHMPGLYIPGCTEEGFYKTQQTHGSTGQSWCVNPATGQEIKGTRRSASLTKPECGACFKAIENRLTRSNRLGAEMPQCNQENGDYHPEQSHEGYRFCVNPKTGEQEGEMLPPSDNNLLPCVNQ